MDYIPSYAPTPEQQQLSDYFHAASREVEEALDLYKRAVAHTKDWQSAAGAAAIKAIEGSEFGLRHSLHRVAEVGNALYRHFQAEDAARYYLQTTGLAS